ncbi:MAG: TetR/AcrR family transcriptional regulator [Gammaproteobacteria bacterium]
MPSYVESVLDVKSKVSDEALVKQRRIQVVHAAAQLFSEKGYYITTVQEVARHAGVSAGLIYQYVRDKEDLLLLSILDVFDSYATEIPAALEGIRDPLERCCSSFRAYCQVVDARRDATVLAYRSTKSLTPERRHFIMDAEQETNQLIGECIQTCINQGLFRPVNTELATYQLVMYAHAWALKHWHFAKHFNLEAYIKQGLDLYLHAMLTEKGWGRMKQQISKEPFS